MTTSYGITVITGITGITRGITGITGITRITGILYLNPPTNQINLPQLIRSHKKGLNPPTITLFP